MSGGGSGLIRSFCGVSVSCACLVQSLPLLRKPRCVGMWPLVLAAHVFPAGPSPLAFDAATLTITTMRKSTLQI